MKDVKVEKDGVIFNYIYDNGLVVVKVEDAILYQENIGIDEEDWIIEALWDMVSVQYLHDIEMNRLAEELFGGS